MRKFAKAEIEQARAGARPRSSASRSCCKRKPRQLSGGQRQRVALGRAIVRHPQVFLFDEPLSNLDAKLRVQMRVELKKLHERLGTTAIYVTHDQVEAMTLGDRVVVMKDGWVQQVGEPLELYNTPANRFVAGFIGSPAMNFADRARSPRRTARLMRRRTPASSIKVPAAASPTVCAAYAGQQVTLGIRPEDLHIATAADPAGLDASTPWSRWSSSSAPRSCSTSRVGARHDGGGGRADRPRQGARDSSASPSTRRACTSSTPRPKPRSEAAAASI